MSYNHVISHNKLRFGKHSKVTVHLVFFGFNILKGMSAGWNSCSFKHA